MKHLTSDHAIEPSALLFPPAHEPAWQRETGRNAVEGLPAGESPKKHSPIARALVLLTVVLATLAILTTGLAWDYYRLQHTLTNNASVKGRVYKIGARLDGQV